MAYIRTADYDEFLEIQQDLLLRIMDAISTAGSALALPTQASISYSVEEMERPSEKGAPFQNQKLNRSCP